MLPRRHASTTLGRARECASIVVSQSRGIFEMTREEYLRALERLKLPPNGKATAEAFGLTKSQLARLASGFSRVSPTLERLIRIYLRFGVPRLS
jgi:transcriptional regulator with XRE-family HTH domain